MNDRSCSNSSLKSTASALDRVTTAEVEKDGKKFLRVTIDGVDFFLPFMLISGKQVAFLDVSGQVLLIEKTADVLVDRLIEVGAKFDTILNPVAKSNALAHAIAVRWAQKVDPSLTRTIVARKAKPGDKHEVEASYRSVTTNSDQTMYIAESDLAYMKGKNILLVDDVFGGGGTTRALRELVRKAGANVSAHAVASIEQGANIPEDLVYLYTLPVID